MSISHSIRGALQTRAATAAGFPPEAQRAYQGRGFKPTTGTPYARMTVIPASVRPSVLSGARAEHRGMFQVDLYFPTGGGTGAVEQVGDAVAAVFRAASKIHMNGETVVVERVERKPAPEEDGWLRVIVSVTWRCFSASAIPARRFLLRPPSS